MKQTTIYLVIIGMSLSWIALSINQLIPYQFNLASLVSPTGAQVTVAGFRIKHWIVGVILAVLAYITYTLSSKKSPFKTISPVMTGAGIFLVIDEYEAVMKFITTGAYP